MVVADVGHPADERVRTRIGDRGHPGGAGQHAHPVPPGEHQGEVERRDLRQVVLHPGHPGDQPLDGIDVDRFGAAVAEQQRRHFTSLTIAERSRCSSGGMR